MRIIGREAYGDDWRRPIMLGDVKIKTKDMRLIPLVPNAVQKRLIDLIWEKEQQGKPVRVMIPKARQHGISTITEAIIYCKTAFQPNVNAIIVCDKSEHAANIFEMAKLMHEQMNPVIRTETHRRNAFELAFSENHSKIEIGTTGRSGTYHLFHSSETAYYTDAENTMLGVLQTVPNIPGTMVIMESTGNGIGNYFEERCQQALRGEIDYELFFIPWYENPEYSLPMADGEELIAQSAGLFGDECYYQSAYDLSQNQLKWRRYAISSLCGGDIQKFMQEYPASLDECFQGSGYPVFSPIQLALMAGHASAPAETGVIEDGEIVLSSDLHGYLKVWHRPDAEKHVNRYVIGADTGGTWEGADYDCAYVYDRLERRVAAQLHGHFDAYQYVEMLAVLSAWYYDALLAIEVNRSQSETDEFGNTVIDLLMRNYPRANVYTRKIIDDLTKQETVKIGWLTTHETKQGIVDRLRRFVNEYDSEPIQFNDHSLITEMQTYIVQQTKTGKTSWGAVEGKKDDRVMSFGIGLVVADTMAAPRAETRLPEQRTTNNAIEAVA